MRLLALLAALALAGCTQEEPGSLLVGVNAPPPSHVFPSPDEVPGFLVGHTTSQKGTFDHMIDGESRVYDRANGSGMHRLSVGVILFESPERAAEVVSRVAHPPQGTSSMEPFDLGDEAFHESVDLSSSGRDRGWSQTLVVRENAYMLWISYQAMGADPELDAVEVARKMAARAEAQMSA